MRITAIAACVLGLLVASGCGERSTVEGLGGHKLTLVGPIGVTVRQGDVAEFTVRIERQNLASPVVVTVAHLPAGVHATDSGVSIVGVEGKYHLQADVTADLVANHQATLTASAPEGIAASVTFSVTVTPVK